MECTTLVSQNWTVSSHPADTNRLGLDGWYRRAKTRFI